MKRIDITPEWYEEIEVPASEFVEGAFNVYRYERDDGVPLFWWVVIDAYDTEVNSGHFDTEAEALEFMRASVMELPGVVECESCGKHVPEHRYTAGDDVYTPGFAPSAVPGTCLWCPNRIG